MDTEDDSSKSLKAYLERISILFHTIIPSGDFDYTSKEGIEVAKHITSDYQAYWDVISSGLSFDEANAILKERASRDGRVKFDVTSMATTVDDEKGFATVYSEFTVGGWTDSVNSEIKGFDELAWRRDEHDGQWRIMKHQAMRIEPTQL